MLVWSERAGLDFVDAWLRFFFLREGGMQQLQSLTCIFNGLPTCEQISVIQRTLEMMNKTIHCEGSTTWGPIRTVPVSLLPYRKHGYLAPLRHDAMKSLSHCGLFLYKHLNTLVLKSYTANLKRSYLFSNRMPWFAFM